MWRAAISSARKLPPDRQKARTEWSTSARFSTGRRRISASFMSATHPCLPTYSSQVESATSSSAGTP